MSSDRVFQNFLRHQYEEGTALAEGSDLMDLTALGGTPPDRYIATFRCTGLVHTGSRLQQCDEFVLGIRFPADYLRRTDVRGVLTVLAPLSCFHPNVFGPAICVGHMPPGTPLVELLTQVFEIFSWRKLTCREDDALNHAACAWARRNLDRLPTDDRPLRRRRRAP